MSNRQVTRPDEVAEELWEEMGAEGMSAGRWHGLVGQARPPAAAREYAERAMEEWGELLSVAMPTLAMEASRALVEWSYDQGYAAVLGEAYAAGYQAGRNGEPCQPREYGDMAIGEERTVGWGGEWRRWRWQSAQAEADARPQHEIVEAYLHGHYAGRGASHAHQ